MRLETVAKAKAMLARVLNDGLSFAQAGEEFRVSRSTAERTSKRLLEIVARDVGIPGVEADVLTSLRRLLQHRHPVLTAVHAYAPSNAAPQRCELSDEAIARGVVKLRSRSGNANRDAALLLVLLGTGAKPIEIARLQVRDYLLADGACRSTSVLPAAAAANGRSRPLHFTAARARDAVDAYLTERARRGLRAGRPGLYRGLDPESPLFLIAGARSFVVQKRAGSENQLTCPHIIEAYRKMFVRAGWPGFTTQAARRLFAQGLKRDGADIDEIGVLLGISKRSVPRLLDGAV